MGTATGTDPVLFEHTDGEWSYRYGPPSDEYWPYGKTVCCKRPVHVPTEIYRRAVPVSPPPMVTDCCDTPGVPKPVELPPYSGEHAACRKCGSRAVETSFKGPGVVASWPGAPTVTESMLGPSGYPEEWLARRCVVCRATWDEATVAENAGAGAQGADDSDCPHKRLDAQDTSHGPRGWKCDACGGSGPTVLSVLIDSSTPRGVAIRGMCVCGDGWQWPAQETGIAVQRWLSEHADCKAAADG